MDDAKSEKHVKVAIYIRVSTRHQIDKDSLKVQKKELVSYCRFIMNCNDYEIFEDAGFSAKNTDRPDYQTMMEKIRTGNFTHLLVWKIDRISRNLVDFANMYAELKKLGVDFISKNEQFDTSTAMGEAMLKIILVFAELERKMTSERVTAVMMSRANNGQWNGGRVNFGYSYNKKTDTFTPNEDAEIIKRIFLLYELYETAQDVTYILNHTNTKSPTGKGWKYETVHRILSTRFYIGDYVYNRLLSGAPKAPEELIVIRNHHPAIISEEVFERVQALLKKQERKTTNLYHVRSHSYIMDGLLVCEHCNKLMSGHTQGPSKKHPNWAPLISYTCKNTTSKSGKCSNAYVREDYLVRFLFTFAYNLLLLSNGNAINKRTNLMTIQTSLLKGCGNADKITVNSSALSAIKKSIMSHNTVDLSLSFAGSSICSETIASEEEKCNRYMADLERLELLHSRDADRLSDDDYAVNKELITQYIQIASDNIDRLTKELFASESESTETYNKATLLLLQKSIRSGEEIDIPAFINSANREFLHRFFMSIYSEVAVTNGVICRITFNNGIVCKFVYAK